MDTFDGGQQPGEGGLAGVLTAMSESSGVKQEPLFSGLSPGPFMPIPSQGHFMIPTSTADRIYDFSFVDAAMPAADKKPPLHPNGSRNQSQSGLESCAKELPAGSKAQGNDAKPCKPQRGPTKQALSKSGSPEKEDKKMQQVRLLQRSQSALELRSLSKTLPSHGSTGDLQNAQYTVELTTPEGHTYTAGRLSNEERAQKILRYRQKRHERNFNKRIKYMCRKTLADSRPRVRGRFARNDDADAVMPHETKKALAEKARKEKKASAEAAKSAAALSQQSLAISKNAKVASRSSFESDLTDLIPNTAPVSYNYDARMGSSATNFGSSFGQVPYGMYQLSSFGRPQDNNSQ